MKSAQIEDACAYALTELEKGLDKKYVYHNLWHTKHDVMVSVVRLAGMSKVSQAETDLLKVAAAYHDIGFLVGQQGHEEIGIQYAADALPRFGFDLEEIERIQEMIMATQLPQSPKNLLGQIMADSDLDLLGREDFFYRSEQLRREIAILGEFIPLQVWLERQIEFLSNHRYFTAASKKIRDGRKKEYIKILKRMVSGKLSEEAYFFDYVGQSVSSSQSGMNDSFEAGQS